MTIDQLDPASREFYHSTLTALTEAHAPFLVGGAYAFERYTAIARHTKDLDVFVRPSDYERTAQILEAQGYRTELTYPHWLGKAFHGDNFVDIIFRSNNSVAEVDDLWFEHAIDETVCDVAVKLCPPEEMIWNKALIMERERYDGADVAHLLRACAEQLDWERLLQRFGSHWRVLLSHLILFGFIYPAEQEKIPRPVLHDLIDRLQNETNAPSTTDHLCGGTLLSATQYVTDIEEWGYKDARIQPWGNMTAEEATGWTQALLEQNEP